MNQVLDEVEDETSQTNEAVGVILHPPGDGDNSDENDDETPCFSNLPLSLLLSNAETNLGQQEGQSYEQEPAKKRQKKPKINWASGALPIPEYQYNRSEISFQEDCVDPIDFFLTIFDEKIQTFIHEQTNLYSDVNASLNEILVVIGVLLASGVVTQSRRRDYWSSSSLKKNSAIASAISQKRYEIIFSHLHFMPKDAISSNDKFQKVRLLISLLNKSFLKNAPTTNAFSIDESMIPYFGRHGCKQFIRGKPIRFGFKVWMAATIEGYCVQLQPYPGVAEKPGEDYDLSSSGNVIFFFSKILSSHFSDQRPISVTMDNYFSSLPLMQALREKLGVLSTGTVRRNRIPSFPFDDKNEKTKKRGSMEIYHDSSHGVNLVSWKDNKSVLIASTLHGVDPVAQTQRYSRQERKKIAVARPAIVKHYNETMGGVDLHDAHVANCRTSLRGKNGTSLFSYTYWMFAL